MFWAVVIGAALLFVSAAAAALGYKLPPPLAPIGGGLYLRADAAAAWQAMVLAAAADGVRLAPSPGRASAYRTEEDQARMLLERPEFAAPNTPQAPHRRAVAVDAQEDGQNPRPGGWVDKNAARFKFHRPVPGREPWHMEYRP